MTHTGNKSIQVGNVDTMHRLAEAKESTSERELITFVTNVWTLTRAIMNTLVCGESAAGCTSIHAFVAGVWTVAGMNAQMYIEIAVGCASKTTLVACERALARMNAFVNHE